MVFKKVKDNLKVLQFFGYYREAKEVKVKIQNTEDFNSLEENGVYIFFEDENTFSKLKKLTEEEIIKAEYAGDSQLVNILEGEYYVY